jgi:ADP-ribose pyrophosphatase
MRPICYSIIIDPGEVMIDGPAFEKIIGEEILYRGTYLNLKKIQIELPDGRQGMREIVEVRDASAILALDEKQNVLMVRQSRPAVNRTGLEIPAGLMDPGESEEQAVLRECEEETGYQPKKIRRLIRYAHAEGYSTGFITLFLGMDLVKTGKMQLDTTEYLEPVFVPFDELVLMVRKNQIIDSKTILCVVLCECFIRDGCRDENLLKNEDGEGFHE